MKDRRKILKGIGVGSAWSTPVIHSVVLPAHAQTSDDYRLVIQGFQWGCNPLVNTNAESYDVNDRTDPPTLIKSIGFGVNQRAILMKRTLFDITLPGGGIEITSTILIQVEEQRVISSEVECNGPANPSPVGAYRYEFSSLLGKPWQIEYFLSQ